jgi:hypothetical protein
LFAASQARLARSHGVAAALGLALACLAFYAAMPALGFVAGKEIQVYHFQDRFQRASSWVVIAATSALASMLLVRPARLLLLRSRRPVLVAVAAEAALALLTTGCIYHELRSRQYEVVLVAPRRNVALGSSYKADLVDVTRELSRARYADQRVLGTLDHGLSVWWTSFHHRFLLVSDPFPSTRSDAEQESRLAHLLHLLGVSSATFEGLIQDGTLQIMWLSSAKYTISPLHAFAPISAYDDAQAKIIREGSPLSGWEIAVPRSEVKRLSQAYANETSAPWRLTSADVVVLGPWERAYGMAPDWRAFRETFSNSTFRVWVRR